MRPPSWIHRSRKHRGFNRQTHPAGTAGALTAVLISLLLAAGAVFLVYQYTKLTADIPATEELEKLLDPDNGDLLQPTVILDRSGRYPLWYLDNPGGTEREFVRLAAGEDQVSAAVSEEMILAVLAAEDPGFFQRPDFSLSYWWREPGDTLPEKMVEELLLWGDGHTPWKDLRTKLLAAQILSEYGRVKVLEWYLNSADFGQQIYGVETAAKYYFGKPAADLSLAEAALLASTAKFPALNPLDAPVAALENQQTLLDEMAASGVITGRQAQQAAAEELTFQNHPAVDRSELPDFVNAILQEAERWIPRDRLLRGGLRIITTIDSSLQQQLECTLNTQLVRAVGVDTAVDPACKAARLLPRADISAVGRDAELVFNVVILDPRTGQLLGMASRSSTPGDSGSLLDAHPPGSLLTPLIYLNEFTRGVEPASLVWDIPPQTGELSPQALHPGCSQDCQFYGPVSVRTALANDFLAPARELWLDQGPMAVDKTLSQLGIQLDEDRCQDCVIFPESPYLSVIDAAQIYGVFANQGVISGKAAGESTGGIKPGTVLAVEDQAGRRLTPAEQTSSQVVISQQLAYLVNDVLTDSHARRDLPQSSRFDIGRPAAVKSGLTSNGGSAWIVGYTPQLVTAIWAGDLQEDSPAAEEELLWLAAGIWRAVTQHATNQLPVEDWPRPEGMVTLEVCKPSGQLPTGNCPEVVREIFIEGNQPVQGDTLYQMVEINRETGLRASVFTPPEQIEQRVFINVPEKAREWAEAQGLPTPPETYDLFLEDELNDPPVIEEPENFAHLNGIQEITGTTPEEDFISYRIQFGQGLNPDTWQQLGEETFSPASGSKLAVWDTTSLDDGLYAVQLVVLLDGQRVEKSSLVVSVDNTPPMFSLVPDLAGEKVQLDSWEKILFRVQGDTPEEIKSVRFYFNNRLKGRRETSPFVFLWEPTAGEQQFRVVVEDLAGNRSDLEMEFQVVR